MFFKFPEILLIISSEKEKFLVLAVFRKTFLSEKNPTSTFKIGGFCGQKRFFKFVEISPIISFEKEEFLVAAVSEKLFLSEKNPTSSFKIGGIL